MFCLCFVIFVVRQFTIKSAGTFQITALIFPGILSKRRRRRRHLRAAHQLQADFDVFAGCFIPWIEAQGCIKMSQGVLQAVKLDQGRPHVIVSAGMIRPEAQGFSEISGRFREFFLPGQGRADIVAGLGIGGI